MLDAATPVVNDYTEVFCQVRDKHVKRRAKNADRVMNQLKLLSLSLGSQVGGAGGIFGKKQEGMLSSGTDVDPTLVTNCSICETPFKRFFTNKQRCCNCGSVICANCCSQSVEVEAMNSETPKEIKVCDNCYSGITKERKRQNLKQYLESSKKSPFVVYYEELYFSKSTIEKKLPKFKALVNGKPTTKAIEQAKELDSCLMSHVKDLEVALKRIDLFKVSTKKQQAVKDTIKGAFLQYLALVVPEFRVLHKQLDAISKNPISDEPAFSTSPTATTPNPRYSLSAAFSNSLSSFKTMLRGNDGTGQGSEDANDSGPFIEAIHPLLCPLKGGTQLTIHGKRFGTNSVLKIGGSAATCISQTDAEIIAVAPPLREPGFKDVCVERGNLQCILSQLLIYSDNDECFEPQTSPSGHHMAPNSDDEYDNYQTETLIIEALNPVVSPLSGTKISMTVKGRLPPDVVVKVSGVVVHHAASQTDSGMLYFISPPLSSGLKTITLWNSNRQISKLEDVLLYEDLPPPPISSLATSPNSSSGNLGKNTTVTNYDSGNKSYSTNNSSSNIYYGSYGSSKFGTSTSPTQQPLTSHSSYSSFEDYKSFSENTPSNASTAKSVLSPPATQSQLPNQSRKWGKNN